MITNRKKQTAENKVFTFKDNALFYMSGVG